MEMGTSPCPRAAPACTSCLCTAQGCLPVLGTHSLTQGWGCRAEGNHMLVYSVSVLLSSWG